MVFTDPPYNVAIAGNVSGLGKVKHREFAMASGEMSADQFSNFLETAFMRLAHCSTNGSIHFICMDWRHISELLDAAAKPYRELKNLCIWSKTNAGMGSLYRSQHELVFVFKNGNAQHINNVELGRFGRNRSNVWNYAGVNSFGQDRDTELAMHPTVMPAALVADAILDCSKRGGIVLDAFAGSGTTLVAAEKTGRRGYGIEIDPYYTDTIIRRFDEVYGLKAVHAKSNLDFDAVSRRRSTPKEKKDDQKKQKDCSQQNTKAPDQRSAAVTRSSRRSFARAKAAILRAGHRARKTSAPSSGRPPTSKLSPRLTGNSEGFPRCRQPRFSSPPRPPAVTKRRA